MKKNNILNKIKSREVKIRPRWEFAVRKWAEIGLWIVMMGMVVWAIMSIAYFMTIYSVQELAEFGDLGWQIFYEDFPYIWGSVAIFSLVIGFLIMIKTGENYKRSWQQNLMIMSGIILFLTIVGLFLKL